MMLVIGDSDVTQTRGRIAFKDDTLKKRMIVIASPGRHDTFWCSQKCDTCVLRYRCYTEPEKDAFELDLEDYRHSGLELGEEIG